MIDAEELPSIALACKVKLQAYTDSCLYCFNLAERSQGATWETALLAASAGYVAGVRHERKRQRQKATAEKQPAPGNITGQEMELLAAWRMIGDADKKLIFKMAKYWQKEAQKEAQKEKAASAGTPTA
ncbi:hypothetical protein [Phascolarctobacterium succinatutens]|uniref:hypothetical protein n=1 Tax=Phascolarctobacterium succinatutens TaxID=626940 RepID=UPI0025EEA96A|nr:hypothetical protein [Phascolarctobacterium succinatutens]